MLANKHFCECCGKEFERSLRKDRGGNLKPHPHQKYCSNSCMNRNYYNKNILNVEFRLNKLCAMAKNRAKEKQLDFDITTEHLIELWNNQDGKCALSDTKFVLESGSGRVNKDTVSVDRIIPELGYTIGNVRLVTYHVNVCLSEFGEFALYELARKLIKGISA